MTYPCVVRRMQDTSSARNGVTWARTVPGYYQGLFIILCVTLREITILWNLMISFIGNMYPWKHDFGKGSQSCISYHGKAANPFGPKRRFWWVGPQENRTKKRHLCSFCFFVFNVKGDTENMEAQYASGYSKQKNDEKKLLISFSFTHYHSWRKESRAHRYAFYKESDGEYYITSWVTINIIPVSQAQYQNQQK